MPIASQVNAVDSVKGVQVNADRSELDQAVKDGKQYGLDITESEIKDKGSVNSNSEVDAKLAEINADYKEQIQKIKQAKAKMAEYKVKKAEYDKEKAKYDEELKKYMKKLWRNLKNIRMRMAI